MSEKVQVAKPEAKRENKVSQTQKTGPSQSISSPVDQILFLQRTIGNQAVGGLIKSGALKAKLRIGQPGDIYEQEADRMAEQVMRMPEPEVLKEKKATNSVRNNSIQRKCPGCNKGINIEKEEKLRKKEVSGPTHEVTPQLESSISAFRRGGQPLPESVRSFYEPRFGHDFSGVRVHTDAKAAEAAQAVNARAFTIGKDVIFGSGQYSNGMGKGGRLLAHELTHVVQQDSSPSNNLHLLENQKKASYQESTSEHSKTNHNKKDICPSLQLKEDVQLQVYENKDSKSGVDMLRSEAKEDAQKVKKIFQDNIVLGPFDQSDIMEIIEKWAKKPIDTGTKLAAFDYLIVALRGTTFEVGTLIKQYTSSFDQIFNSMSSGRVEKFKGWMQTRARVFKDDKAIEEVSLTEEFKEGKLKKTAEEFWSARFKSMGEFLKSIGTPTIIQNLLGGLVGVIQGFAELLVELIEGVWSLVEAVDHILSTILYFITGAAEGAGLSFLKKIPLVGKNFDPETYKDKYEATINFFESAGAALQNPGKILDGIKASAIKAWDETLDEYNKSDDFNKSRVIAKGVVKVGMAVGGFIKSLPGLAKSAVKIGKTLEKGVVRVGKTIGKAVVAARKIIDEALQGAIKLGRKIFRGIWRVIEETTEGGGKKLRYYFKKSGYNMFEEVSEDMAKPCLKCSSPCNKTEFAKNLEKIPEDIPEEAARVLDEMVKDPKLTETISGPRHRKGTIVKDPTGKRVSTIGKQKSATISRGKGGVIGREKIPIKHPGGNKLAQLRKEFDKKRAAWLKKMAEDPRVMEFFGEDSDKIKAMKGGKLPEGYEVHHNHPISAGGKNVDDNFTLIPDEIHKRVTSEFNDAVARGIKEFEFPKFDDFVGGVGERFGENIPESYMISIID